MQTVLIVGGSLLVLGIAVTFLRSVTAARPDHLGAVDGKLAPAPSSPNCVSTQTDSESHKMEPISYQQDDVDVIRCLREIVLSQPNATVIEETDSYLYAEFRSQIFRFVDDVEFLIDKDSRVVHFRSASRTGHSDLGVNRSRMNRIRTEFLKRNSSPE